MPEKPECELVGTDGNIFALVGRAAKALRRAGMKDEAAEMSGKVMKSDSYDEALQIIMQYVDAY